MREPTCTEKLADEPAVADGQQIRAGVRHGRQLGSERPATAQTDAGDVRFDRDNAAALRISLEFA